jgi:hypothetical protein
MKSAKQDGGPPLESAFRKVPPFPGKGLHLQELVQLRQFQRLKIFELLTVKRVFVDGYIDTCTTRIYPQGLLSRKGEGPHPLSDAVAQAVALPVTQTFPFDLVAPFRTLLHQRRKVHLRDAERAGFWRT